MELCPVVFRSRLVPKIWGGRRLEAWGKELPAGESIGESWELYDDGKGATVAAQGPAQGRSLRELANAWGEDLTGRGHTAWCARFPLLVKLLDASADLSVQVHPNDATARRLEGPQAYGKHEVFVVLEAEPGASILNGWVAGTDPAAVLGALKDGSLERLLNRVEVKAGDVLDVPAGRPHAIGKGCSVAEVQQNSELTYRLWDYQRLENGRPRELHVVQALQALRFDEPFASSNGLCTPPRQDLGWAVEEALVDGPYFGLKRLALRAPNGLGPTGVPTVLFVLRGELRLAWGGGTMTVPAGSVALLPAALRAQLAPGPQEAQVLWIEPR